MKIGAKSLVMWLKGQNKMLRRTQIELKHVALWVRLQAFIIDSLLIMAILLLVTLIIPAPESLSVVDVTKQEALLALVPALLARPGFDAMFAAVVFLLLWNLIQSSLEKTVFGGQTIDFSEPSAMHSQLPACYLGYFVSRFCIGLGFIGLLLIQRNMDGMTNTRVPLLA